jgi:predicted metal-binding protein
VEELIDIAIQAGASSAKLMDAGEVVIDERVRLKCSVPRCNAYAACLTCPPNTMAVEEFRKTVERYQMALVVQVETGQNSLDKSSESLGAAPSKLLQEHLETLSPFQAKLDEAIAEVEREAFKRGYSFAAGFGAGRCRLCGGACPGIVDGKCRHPFRARPAMEAMGIDIQRTAENAGLSVELSSEANVKWTGLVLID